MLLRFGRCLSQSSLRKTEGKVSPILVTLTSSSDSNFERSNISLKENKRDDVDPSQLIHSEGRRRNSTVFGRLSQLSTLPEDAPAKFYPSTTFDLSFMTSNLRIVRQVLCLSIKYNSGGNYLYFRLGVLECLFRELNCG